MAKKSNPQGSQNEAPKAKKKTADTDEFKSYQTKRTTSETQSRANTIKGEKSRGAAPQEQKRKSSSKSKKKRSRLSRKQWIALSIILFFVAFAATAFIGVFLVFKLEHIEITGDKIYANEDIITICNYHLGDNLFFLSTTDKEEQLQKELPFIEHARIKRRIPNTIEIKITAVKLNSMIEQAGNFMMVDRNGKIVEITKEKKAGYMLVQGMELLNPKLSEKIVAKNPQVGQAYQEIVEAINSLDAVNEITRLDFQNMQEIRMYYQDRIEMQLGVGTDLSYKVINGISTAQNPDHIPETDKGILKLQLAKEGGKSYYTKTGLISGNPSGETGKGGENAARPLEKLQTQNEGRGSDIPDYPYTGKKESQGSSTNEEEDGKTSDSSESGSSSAVDNSGESSEQSREPESSAAEDEDE